MNEAVVKTKSGRGPAGQIAKWLFIIFNGLMLLWLISGLAGGAHAAAGAGKAGASIGTVIGAGLIIFIWVAGAVILGLFALLTRAPRTAVYDRFL